MMKTTLIAACLAPMASVCGGSPPDAAIANSVMRARVYLPDAQSGFYRGTRFDWSGVISGLEYAGHNYFPQWFDRADSKVHDFIYDGPDIVAGPCTAITGPCEEFVTQGKALGFDEAKAEGTFIKIGVGVLRKPDDGKYDMFRLYQIVDGGQWSVRQHPDRVEFEQLLADPSSGYGYAYHKTVSLTQGKPQLVLDHRLRNTGKRAIQTSVYNHNFLYLDRQPPGPDFTLTVPFAIQTTPLPDNHLAEVMGNRVAFVKTLAGEDRVYFGIAGFGADPKDYDIRIENRKLGAGVRITADRPLSRVALWSIRAPLSLEPFIDMTVEPGAEFTWRITYDCYTIPNR